MGKKEQPHRRLPFHFHPVSFADAHLRPRNQRIDSCSSTRRPAHLLHPSTTSSSRSLSTCLTSPTRTTMSFHPSSLSLAPVCRTQSLQSSTMLLLPLMPSRTTP